MSQENVEIVRRLYAEWERGNFRATEGLDPNIRMVWAASTPDGEAESVGLEQVAEAMKRWLEPFDRLVLKAERIIEAGDLVVVISDWRGSGKGSGIETTWRLGTVWTFQNGQAVGAVAYETPGAALEAVGLSE
jgi:ketosteroid isomerase-like protein